MANITARLRFGPRPLSRAFRIVLGSSIDVTAEFLDDAGAATSVTGVNLSAQQPDGGAYAWAEGVLTETSPGVWVRRITPPTLGFWLISATCTGPQPEAASAYIVVLASGDTGVDVLPEAAGLTGVTGTGLALVQAVDAAAARSAIGAAPATSVLKTNVATINPTVSDDSTLGYSAGSRWLNTATGGTFNCFSAAAGAAVWVPMDAADSPGPWSGAVYPVLQQLGAPALVLAADTAYALLLMPDFAANILSIGPRVTTGGGTGGAFKAAVLPHDPATRRPGATAIGANNGGTAAVGTGLLLGSLATAARINPGVPVWILGTFFASAPLPVVLTSQASNMLLAQQLGLGVPGASAGGQPTGFSTPFPFASDIGAPNAFAGATWTAVNGPNSILWSYGI